jgi:hypothetical protein
MQKPARVAVGRRLHVLGAEEIILAAELFP